MSVSLSLPHSSVSLFLFVCLHLFAHCVCLSDPSSLFPFLSVSVFLCILLSVFLCSRSLSLSLPHRFLCLCLSLCVSRSLSVCLSDFLCSLCLSLCPFLTVPANFLSALSLCVSLSAPPTLCSVCLPLLHFLFLAVSVCLSSPLPHKRDHNPKRSVNKNKNKQTN